MKIKFTLKDKIEIYENISKPRRYHMRDKTYIQFLKNGKYVRVDVNKGDRYEVVE